MPAAHGAFLDHAPADWQILQQDANGFASLRLAGHWLAKPDQQRQQVMVRLVRTLDAVPVAAHLDWQPAAMEAGERWTAELTRIPAGGPYRLETQLRTDQSTTPEWALRGDARDLLGVGDLWIIAGQSNSAGYGKGPVDDPPEIGLHLFDNAQRWRLATHPLNDSTGTVHPVNTENANPGHAPWLQFARILRRTLNHPIGLIQTALGGSPLSRWNPREGAPGSAELFDNLVQVVQAAGGKVRGVLWYQGCSDTSAPAATTYLDRFAQAVAAWREALAAPDLPVITVQLNRVTSAHNEASHLAWSQVREAQRQAARAIPGVLVVPASDLPLSDFIHTSPVGNLILGHRAAAAALDQVYGIRCDWRAPDIAQAGFAADRKQVIVTVDQVTGELRSADGAAQPVRIDDADGTVPIEKVHYAGGKMIVELGRPANGSAWLTMGYGTHPPLLPIDMTRNIPMLSCWKVPIAE